MQESGWFSLILLQTTRVLSSKEDFIARNVLICQDMVRSYERINSSPGRIIKMDMKKTYDSVD